MPLLNRKPFSTDAPPSDLNENEEVFICRQTNEVYRDYESFFNRTILCNSLVWSCEVTLKHGLTFEEALDCEKEARKIAEHVPVPIQRGILTLVHYTRHSRLDNLCDEVFNYIRDRYQEEEEVEVKYNGEKFVGYIHNVIEPSLLTNGYDSKLSSPTLNASSTKKLNSPHGKKKSGKNLPSPSKPDDGIIVISDGENEDENKEQNCKSPGLSSPKPSAAWPDAKSYQYDVKLKNHKNLPARIPEFITVKQSSISRKKGTFSREKVKLLLRVTCCRSTAFSEDGYWKVNDKYRKKFDLSPDVDQKTENIPIVRKAKKRKNDAGLNGESISKKRKKSTNGVKEKKKKKDEGKKNKKDMKDDKKPQKEKGLKKLSAEEIEKAKLEMKLQREKEKEERKREKDIEKELRKKEREKARHEKQELLREQKLFLLRWCVPQEDLDLGDLKDLPTPVPVKCKFSGEMFGTIVMVLEFLHIFGEFFDMKQDFPDGISYEMLEQALVEHDAEGVFYDILKFLLQCILKTHAEEEEEEGLDDSDVQAQDETENEKDQEEDDKDCDFTRVKKAVSASASMAASWAQLYQGKNLHELTLDPFTCSEILRLHFLSSGARLVSGPEGDTYRWQRRGGFTFSDDAGVAFRHREHGIMRALVTGNIYDLDPTDKLKILSTLCIQLLTYASTRDIIDDGFERWRKTKREWQEELWADQRKDKEEAAAKYRKKQEEKAREREEKEKEKEKKLMEIQGGNPGDSKEQVDKQNSSNQDSKATSNESVESEQKAITRSQGPVPEEPVLEDESKEQFEREERKEKLKQKEKAFAKELRKSQAMSGVQPLGTDRLFRRYWLFNAVSGLFIEDNDPEFHKLLQSKDNDVESSEGESADDSVSDSGEEERSTMTTETLPSLNPEDDINKTSESCILTKEQIQVEKELCRILKLYGIPLESLPESGPLTRWEQGGKKEENYEKFRTRNVIQWSYLDKKEDFDQLLSTLNPRGFRERNLREGLLQYYGTIVKGLEDNPVRVENRERNEEMQQQRIVRNKRGGLQNQPQAVDKSLYRTMEDFIEANLRDQILDLEDRIWQAGFGSVKTGDINSWRKDVENGIYDFLPAPGSEVTNGADKTSVNGFDVNSHGADGVEKMEVDEEKETQHEVAQDSVENKTTKRNFLPCLENSRPGTPVDGSFVSTPTTSSTPQAINPCVRILAKAVLELEQGIERKYLIPPLGDDEETKKRKLQEAADAAKAEFDEMMAAAGKKKKDKVVKNDEADSDKQENGNDGGETKEESVAKPQKTLLERWEGSLMASTNLSQLSIHLTNLDNCISWDKSVLNARCRICRRKGDAEHMLLCDGCDRGHHMYCLKPPIKEVPEGDWFCPTCRPKEPRRSFRKNRRKEDESDEEPGDSYKTKSRREELEDSGSEEDESSEEEEDSDDEEEESDEDGDDDEEEESDEVAEDSAEEGSVHTETCACCDGGGELLCCETCPLAYHLECAYPPLRRVPRGNWACQVCTGADSELPAGRRVKKSVIKAAQKRANGSEVSPQPTKKAKTATKKTNTKNEAKKPGSAKRQTNQSTSNTPSPASSTRSRKTPAVRVSGRKTSKTPTGQSKSEPRTGSSKTADVKTTNVKWTHPQAKKCEMLLNEIKQHEDSWPFLFPVDVTEVPDYPLIIKTPMDLNTVETKLSSHQYDSVEEFAADVRQIFFNCSEYNKPRTREARSGVRLSALFETRFGELGLDATENRSLRTRRSR